MNVSCTSCSAKYAIPDEKVRGKKVKITCKHCSTGIIVDGTKLDAAGDAPAAAPTAPVAATPTVTAPMPAVAAKTAPIAATPAPAPAAAPTAPATPTELSFDIAYPDDRQETLTVSQIVDKYAAGTLDDLAFLWREGMTDWKAPFDIPELASALTVRGLKKDASPFASAFSDDDEATKIQESPFDSPEATGSSGVWTEPGKEPPSNPAAAFDLRAPASLPFEAPEPSAATPSPRPAATSPSPQPAAVAAAAPKPEAAKPTAARRTAARGGGDLFGDLAAAGSEEDESLGVDAKDAAPKMTGARNESSVLFSLDALVKQEQKPAAKKSAAAKQDDAAVFLMGTDSSPNSIANVGTGSFGSAFAAPDFNAPVLAPPPEVRASEPVEFSTDAPAKKKGMGLWIGIAAVVALAGGAFATGLPAKLAGTAAPAPTPSATVAAAPPPVAPAPAPEASAAATEPSAAPAASVAPAVAATGGAAAVPAAATPTTPAATPGTPTAATKPTEAATKPEKPAEAPAASDAPPFDKAAAISALSAAAGNAQSCKTADSPGGNGKVSITFMPSGRATNTQVSGDLAGTAVGGCVARLFRSAKVPPFSGEAVTVSKSFTVQ
jgi:predicted Zn finger-like uncharacterized protein